MRIDDAYAYLFTWIIIQVQMLPKQGQGILALFSYYCSLIGVSRKLTKPYSLYLNSLFDFLSFPFNFSYFLLLHCVYSNLYNDFSLQRVDSTHISFAKNDHLISGRVNHIYNSKKLLDILIIMCVLDQLAIQQKKLSFEWAFQIQERAAVAYHSYFYSFTLKNIIIKVNILLNTIRKVQHQSMNNSPKFLKIDDRLGRRKIKSQHEMHDDESSINWNIQQQNEQSIIEKRYDKNHRKFTLESDRQSTKLEQFNRNSSRNDDDSNNECSCHYSKRISQILDDADISEKSRQQIKEEIKYMRQMLQQLNDELSNRLNRYKLANITPKGMAVTYESQKQTEIFLSKMENNIKFIEVQQRQIREIQGRERLVSDRDYQLELEEQLQFTQREIIQRKKQKQIQEILVNRLDGRLGSKKEPKIVKEYKNINMMKHNILHFYKKYRQNKVIIQQVDLSYVNLIEKDQVLTNKFNECFKIAEENNLAVRANKNYLEYLKERDELKAKKDYLKKKIEVETRSRQFQCQKLQKEIQFLKKQLSFVDKRQELAQSNCQEAVRTTEEYMQKNKIDKKLISKISYKFSDISLKSSRQRSINDNSESLEKVQTEMLSKKPQSKLKIQIQKHSSPKGISKLPSGRYQTMEIEQTFKTKNMESMKLNLSRDKQFRIKPTLHIKKKIFGSSPKTQSLSHSIDQSGISNEEDNNIKLRKLHKILVKKDVDKKSN